MIYGKRLRNLRENSCLTQRELAKSLNINEDALSHYEREYMIMPLKHLISLCDYFDVSLDYVFEFTDELKYSDSKKGYDKIESGKRLKEFRKENKLTQVKLASVLNTVHPVIVNYEKGKHLIATSFLYDLCKKYKVSADYLLGKIDSPKYLGK